MKIKLILFVLVFFIHGCIFDCKEYLNEEIKPRQIYGEVIAMNNEEIGCFGTIILKDKNTYDTLRGFCYCVPKSQNAWEYMAIGDTLYKQKGELQIKVISKGIIRSFQYPCCNH